jgi:putative membrane protein
MIAMNFATTDLALAIAHHILIFSLAGILAFEIGLIRAGMIRQEIFRVARADTWYGILAGAILVVGFTRANIAAKGWAYYSGNAFFWAKIGAFAAVGILSIFPTLAIIRWRRTLRAEAVALPSEIDIRTVRRFLWAEAALFSLIPAFAAAMARGYGSPP